VAGKVKSHLEPIPPLYWVSNFLPDQKKINRRSHHLLGFFQLDYDSSLLIRQWTVLSTMSSAPNSPNVGSIHLLWGRHWLLLLESILKLILPVPSMMRRWTSLGIRFYFFQLVEELGLLWWLPTQKFNIHQVFMMIDPWGGPGGFFFFFSFSKRSRFASFFQLQISKRDLFACSICVHWYLHSQIITKGVFYDFAKSIWKRLYLA